MDKKETNLIRIIENSYQEFSQDVLTNSRENDQLHELGLLKKVCFIGGSIAILAAIKDNPDLLNKISFLELQDYISAVSQQVEKSTT